MGHPSRQRLRVVPYSGSAGEPLLGYSVPSVHSFGKLRTGLRDFRTVLYAGSCTEWIPYTSGLYGPNTFPFWGLPPVLVTELLASVGRLSMTARTYATSLSLSIATCSTCDAVWLGDDAFLPLLPALSLPKG